MKTGNMLQKAMRPFLYSRMAKIGGCWSPSLSPDGSELFYIDFNERKLMSVRFSVVDGEFMPESAEEMIDLGQRYRLGFDVVGDPLRILTAERLLPQGSAAQSPTAVVNWFDELEEKVPAP